MNVGQRIALHLAMPIIFILVVSLLAWSTQTPTAWWLTLLLVGVPCLFFVSYRGIKRTFAQQWETLIRAAEPLAEGRRLNPDREYPVDLQRVVDQLGRIDSFLEERTQLALNPDTNKNYEDALGQAILQNARSVAATREELRLSRRLTDLAPVLLTVISPEGKVRFANRYAIETQGLLPGTELDESWQSGKFSWKGSAYAITWDPLHRANGELLGWILLWKNPDSLTDLTRAVEALAEKHSESRLDPDDFSASFSSLVLAINEILQVNANRVQVIAAQLANAMGIPRNAYAPETLLAEFNTNLSALMEDARLVKELTVRVSGDDHTLIKDAEARATSVSELHASVTQLAAHHQLTGGTTAKIQEINRLTRDTTTRSLAEINQVHEAIDGITATANQITRAVTTLKHTNQVAVDLINGLGEASTTGTDQEMLDQAAREMRKQQAHAAKESEHVERLLQNVVLRMNQGGEHLSRAVSTSREIAGGIAGAGKLLDGMISESDMLARCLAELNRLLVSLDKTTANAAIEAESRTNAARELMARAKRLAKGLSVYRANPAEEIPADASPSIPPVAIQDTPEEEPRLHERRRKKRGSHLTPNDIIIENEHYLDDKEFGRY